MTSELPKTAEVIVIGGGVIGTATAFHLTRMGAVKVVLLERKQLAAGATGLSSALVRTHYDNPLEAEIAFKSLPTFQFWDDIVGGDCGFVNNGYVRLVEPYNIEKLKLNVELMQGIGINTRILMQEEVSELVPWIKVEDVPAAAIEPDSGYADPHMTTMGFAAAARRRGAQVFQEVEVTGIGVEGDCVVGVRTPKGDIAAPVVIDAAGPWGGLVAEMAGVHVALTPMHHQVAVVETPDEIPWPFPTIVDRMHYSHFYVRPETGRLSLLGASHDNVPIGVDELDTYNEHLTTATRDRIMERVCNRMPAMETAPIRKGHAGIFVDTLDKHALLGEAPTVKGFYFATGLSGHGFKEAPVVGQAIAELILNGKAEVVDITPLRVSRFDEGEPYEGPYPYGEWSPGQAMDL
jgi:sarcosine oxidase subunit beta